MRTHGLRKFFITQLTNHGVEDKIINFLVCHKISEVDRVYWSRRVEELRRIYAERQQYLNPINGKRRVYDLKKLEDIKAKIKELDSKICNFVSIGDIKRFIKSTIERELKSQISINKFESKIVTTEKELIELSNQGYDCQPIGENKWLMRKKIQM
jgi:hypothetical protein